MRPNYWISSISELTGVYDDQNIGSMQRALCVVTCWMILPYCLASLSRSSLRPEVRFGWTLDFATMVSSQNFTPAYIKVFLLFNVFAMSCVSVLALSSSTCSAAM